MLALQFGQAVAVVKGLYSSTTVYFIAFTCAAATVLVRPLFVVQGVPKKTEPV